MLEVQRNGPQAIAIFCKGMKGTWFTATRMQDSANFWRKRSDVLGIVSVLCWLVGLGVAALCDIPTELAPTRFKDFWR